MSLLIKFVLLTLASTILFCCKGLPESDATPSKPKTWVGKTIYGTKEKSKQFGHEDAEVKRQSEELFNEE